MNTLSLRRPLIRARWQELLRAAPASSPLANPDLLDHLLDPTLDEVLALLAAPPVRAVMARAHGSEPVRTVCACGRNPLLDYFAAGEQALLEALVMAQAGPLAPNFATRNTAVAELYLAVRTIAQFEVEAFCSLCQYRTAPPSRPAQLPCTALGLPHAPAVPPIP